MAAFTPANVPSAYRNGKVLHVPRGAALPANCVKCGAPAQKPWRKKFMWHPQWIYIFVIFGLIGWIIYAIVAGNMRKTLELNVPLCDEHQAARKRNMIIGIVLLLATIPVCILLGNIPDVNAVVVGFVGVVTFIAGLVFLIIAGNYMRPKLIDDSHGEFTGPCETFLNMIPGI